MTDNELERRVTKLESRLETFIAVRHEHDKHVDERFDHIDQGMVGIRHAQKETSGTVARSAAAIIISVAVMVVTAAGAIIGGLVNGSIAP